MSYLILQTADFSVWFSLIKITERSTYFGLLHAKNTFECVKGTITEIHFFIRKKTIINFLSYHENFGKHRN